MQQQTENPSIGSPKSEVVPKLKGNSPLISNAIEPISPRSSDESQLGTLTTFSVERSNDPSQQIVNVENVLARIAQSTPIPISEQAFRSLPTNLIRSEMQPYFQLVRENIGKGVHFNLDDKQTLPQALRSIRDKISLLSPEDVLGTKFSTMENWELRNSVLSRLAFQRANKTGSITIFSLLLGEKFIEEQRKHKDELEAATQPRKDRQTASPQIEQLKMQEWVDVRREEANEMLITKLEGIVGDPPDNNKLHIWLAKIFRLGLTPQDFDSATLSIVTSNNQGEVAGRKIRRPIIRFGKTEKFSLFFKKYTLSPESPNAAYFPKFRDLENGIDSPMSGLIIVGEKGDFTEDHEIAHSMDPYSSDRKGVDGLITEAFACYSEHKSVANSKTMAEILSRYYKIILSKDEQAKISAQEFMNLAEAIVAKIDSLNKNFDEISVQRLLVQSQTIREFLER